MSNGQAKSSWTIYVIVTVVSLIAGTFGGILGTYKVLPRVMQGSSAPVIGPPAKPGATATVVTDQNAIVNATKRVNPCVVNIDTAQRVVRPTGGNPFDRFSGEMPPVYRQGSGSGFVMDRGGYIITNEHVVHQASSIKVTLGEKEYKGTVVGSDRMSDIAVVKIDGGKNLPVATLGDSDKLQSGEWVIAIGNPFREFKHTVTVGVVSALGRPVSVEDRSYENLIQTDAAINMGNSGGPLVSLNGEVVGINTAIFSPTGTSVGIGFAIPINTAKLIVNDLITKGKVIRPYIGAKLVPVPAEAKEYLNLRDLNGALVVEVVKNSPAEKAGLQQYDVIREMDHKKFTKVDEFIKAVRAHEIGDEVALVVLRRGTPVFLKIKIGEMPKE